MPTTNKIINIVILAIFIVVAVFGITGITPSHHHEPGCPFMLGEQTICPMGLSEHISAWKSIFTISIPYIFLLILAGFLVLFSRFFIHPPNYLLFADRLHKQDGYSRISLYQELFSQGILNPKAP